MGKGEPARVVCSVQHGDVVVMAYATSRSRYDVYAVKVSAMRQHFVGTYRTKFFARRRCRRGSR